MGTSDKQKMTELTLDTMVEQDVEKVKQIISATSVGSSPTISTIRTVPGRILPRRTVYGVVVEEFSDDTRNTPAQLEYLSAYEQALAVFRCSALEVRTIMDIKTLEQRLGAQQQAAEETEPKGDKREVEEKEENRTNPLQKQITDSIIFSNRYALYCAGQVGLALLNGEKAEIKNLFSFGTRYDASTERDELTAQLAGVATNDLLRITQEKKERQEKATDDDLKYTLEAIFTSWINQFKWATWKEIAEKYAVDTLTIKYGNYSIQGGEFKRKYNIVLVDDKFMAVKKEDVIGSEEFVETLSNNLIKLLAYNHDQRQNPFDPPGCIFTFGAPGGGKTMGAHAVIQSMAEIAREKGIPLWALTHSVTDFASHYQNLTANQLAALGGKIREHPGPVVMYIADADTLFPSRQDADARQEVKQTMSVYFKMFDGTMIPRNGKFLAIMDANYIEGIDDATKSRLFDVILELKRYEKPEHFAELVRRTMTKDVEGLVRPDEEWQRVGEYLLPSPLRNREIVHVLKQLRSGFTVPVEMLDKQFEEQEQYRNEHLQDLTGDKIIAKFQEYIDTRMEIERKSYEAKKQSDSERWLLSLMENAEQTAAGVKSAK